jgi:hypothetical protein
MEEIDFTFWYETFEHTLRELGYDEPIDRDSAYIDFEGGLAPETAAKYLFDELTNDL